MSLTEKMEIKIVSNAKLSLDVSKDEEKIIIYYTS